MPTPTKPVKILEAERRSHRTKSEISARRESEAAVVTGEAITARKETKKNKIAYKEFRRIVQLLQKIGKADALYTGIINRYCILYAECVEHEERRDKFYEGISALDEQYNERRGNMEPSEYFKLLSDMQSNIATLDKLAFRKRQMLLDIEKECLMTITAALRAIPRTPEEKHKDEPMARLLQRGRFSFSTDAVKMQ